MLEKFFQLKQTNTNFRQETIAGVTTFMTMAYIIFVQPAVLSLAGMDFGSVMVATCLASALATFMMGLLANYPIALAPGMGHNFFFVYTICLAMGIPWQTALGANFISATICTLLFMFGFKDEIIAAVPDSIKNAIAVGIGLLIAFIGFQWSGIVVSIPGTLVGLGKLHNPAVMLSLFGIIFTSLLTVLKVKGAILWGILTSALLGIPLGITKFYGLISLPPSLSPTFLKLNLFAALRFDLILVIFILLFLDIFDTVGTLIGIGEQGNFMVNGKLPRAKYALFTDGVTTLFGTALGTTTLTSYIESAAGVASGGRTGLANMVTGLLFLLALFFSPLVKMIGGGYQIAQGQILYPVTAPALIIVGSLMLQNVIKIKWDDLTESIPAFLTLIIMPFTFSITEGIAFGFISYCFLKLVTGKMKEVHWILYLFALLFILRYILFH
jgi:AGZA family xanthine/uracil permease-like MFS transporter